MTSTLELSFLDLALSVVAVLLGFALAPCFRKAKAAPQDHEHVPADYEGTAP